MLVLCFLILAKEQKYHLIFKCGNRFENSKFLLIKNIFCLNYAVDNVLLRCLVITSYLEIKKLCSDSLPPPPSCSGFANLPWRKTTVKFWENCPATTENLSLWPPSPYTGQPTRFYSTMY